MVAEEVLTEVISIATKASGIAASEKDELTVVLENNDFTVVMVNSIEMLTEALAVMREGFYPHESICNGVRLGDDILDFELLQKADKKQVSGEQGVIELELLTLETAKDGISLLAIDKDTKKVAGAAFNKVQAPCKSGERGFFEVFRNECCQNISAIALIDSMIEVDSRFDVFEHYGVSSVLEVMFLATRPAFRRRGVGALLMRASFKAARARGIPLVTALMTSIYTQRIGRSLGMEELCEVNHDELTFQREPLSVRTGIHKSTVLVAKIIECMEDKD